MRAFDLVCGIAIGIGLFGQISSPHSDWIMSAVVGFAAIIVSTSFLGGK